MILQRRTVVVEGPLAQRMRRFEAAGRGETGIDVVTIPQLAARLAGGFSRLADGEMLYLAIGSALDFDGYREINRVRALPGMARAAADTLTSAWNADLDLQSLAGMSGRMHDIALLERRVREALPAGALIAPLLRNAALERKALAKKLFGPITIDGLVDVEPVWRPLVSALLNETTVEWSASDGVKRSWFEGRLAIKLLSKPALITGDICADPRAEAVEALRWARELLSRGDVNASDIAIVATSPADWDNHFLALIAHADIPLHFSHGIPALASADGQACAALADVLLSGIDQVRIRRLLRRLPRRPFADRLPTDWRSGLPARAGLFDLQQWRTAIGRTRSADGGASQTELVLLPMLELLSRGIGAAEEAGRRLLGGRSLMLWLEALRVAPPAAIGISLQRMRIPDGRDPANCVVWCPANHLAARPRAWTRLLGLSGRSWPRSDRDDALVPDHILARRRLRPISSSEHDRLIFELIVGQSPNGVALSRSHRSAEGSLKSQSPLWPSGLVGTVQGRARIPEHAFSESDRLLARPQEAVRTARIGATRTCWKNRSTEAFTEHDGALKASHPAVLRALARVQSTTSLRRLLRDPLGFVWRYALGWHSPEYARRPLALDPRSNGELIHELLRLTVASLEPAPGFAGADPDQIGVALAAAVETVRQRWPLERPVPPGLLWSHTLEQAASLTMRGLTADERLQSGTRSWTELAFGQENMEGENADLPWDPLAEVLVPSTEIRLKGRIDRVEVRGDGKAVRITDYKSGIPPRNADRIALGRGSEVQRVLYAMAARSLLPDVEAVQSRLLYLGDESPPYPLRGGELDRAATTLAQFVRAADGLLRSGSAAPGPDATDRYNDMRLAHPADLDAYFRRKAASFDAACRGLSPLWSAQ